MHPIVKGPTPILLVSVLIFHAQESHGIMCLHTDLTWTNCPMNSKIKKCNCIIYLCLFLTKGVYCGAWSEVEKAPNKLTKLLWLDINLTWHYTRWYQWPRYLSKNGQCCITLTDSWLMGSTMFQSSSLGSCNQETSQQILSEHKGAWCKMMWFAKRTTLISGQMESHIRRPNGIHVQSCWYNYGTFCFPESLL